MKTILIIEDERQTRENLATMLDMEGYRALKAADGLEGIAVARREKPDLVLCDVSMPEMDGYAVLAALRSDPERRHLPFIFLTARGDRRDQRHGMNLGADDYLVKPATASELLGSIAARLAREQIRTRADADRTGGGFNPDFSSTGPLERLGLTPREAEVSLWVAQGKGNTEIAAILGASHGTIKKHLQSVFEKLGLENRGELMLRVLELVHRD
jgi:DNA-binding NarL/FixJ family response regulator